MDAILMLLQIQSNTLFWNPQPSVLIGCALLIYGYMLFVRFRFELKSLSFLAGVLVLLLALASPLEMLADNYLFSAHMLQHLLLWEFVPPFLILGLPIKPLRRALQRPLLNRIERFLARPTLAWSLGVGAMWVWHFPALYEAALLDQNIHIVEHLIFLVTATLLWWPILTPLNERRMAPFPSLMYLFLAMASSTILGIVLTFAPPGIYPSHFVPDDMFGIIPMLRDQWGMNPRTDQQLGGIMMWIGGSLIYLCAALVALARMFSEADTEPEREKIEAKGLSKKVG
jgi:putative membrane protein